MATETCPVEVTCLSFDDQVLFDFFFIYILKLGKLFHTDDVLGLN